MGGMVDFLGWKLGFLIKILEFLMRFREFLMGVEMEECRQTLTKESGFFVVNHPPYATYNVDYRK